MLFSLLYFVLLGAGGRRAEERDIELLDLLSCRLAWPGRRAPSAPPANPVGCGVSFNVMTCASVVVPWVEPQSGL